MPETYSREGSLLIKKETAPNTAITPNVSIPFNDEAISDNYKYTPATPVQGNRALNIRAIKDKIAAPSGPINLNVEPKTFGYILEGIGDLSSGVLFSLSDVDSLSVGDVLSNGSTGAATVVAIITEQLMVICSGVSGDWATGNTVTSGAHSSTLGTFSSSVYGHLVRLPKDIDNTFTVQRNYVDRAVRWMGVRFHAIDGFAQGDNIITASVQAMAQSVFTHARVTAAVTSGAGAKTILLDQTQGLVAGDSIKVYRPSTGAFLDFSAASVKTHTIGSVSAGASIAITNLQTSLAADDIIVLAPITPSYTVDEEFPWIGGSQCSLGALTSSLASIDVQDYTLVLANDLEERHAASGTLINSRMPSDLLQKGFTASGSFTLHNENEDFRRLYRLNTERAFRFVTTGNQIASTGIYYQLYVTYAEVQIDQYDMPLDNDDIVNEEVPFTSFYNATNGWSVQILLINDIASY